MLKRYRVKLVKKYCFDLDGVSEEDIIEQVNYIMTQTHLLDMPYVDKIVKLKIRKINERKNNQYEQKNN